MRRFAADDEREIDELKQEMAQADDAYDIMGRDMMRNREYRGRLEKVLDQKTMDPVVAKALQLAEDKGYALGANEALGNRIKHLEARIDVRDKELDRTDDRDDWKARAEAAEATIERSKKRKRR